MGKTIADISMSLDGYVAAPGVDLEHGLGIKGEPVHAWVLESPRSPVDEEILQQGFESGWSWAVGHSGSRRPVDRWVVTRRRTIPGACVRRAATCGQGRPG